MADDRARTAQSAAEPSDLRNKILEASVALIEEEGLARLSMREVARRAGVTHQAPYHYFPDREAILGEIAEQGFRLLAASLSHATEVASVAARASGAQSPLRTIVAIGQAYIEFACKHPAHFRIMFRPELVDMDNCPGAREQGQNAFGMLTQAVHDAVANGLPAVPSETALVTLTWSVGHGLSCLLLDGPLAEKMPSDTREAQIRDVSLAFGALLEASMAQASVNRDVNTGSASRERPHPRAKRAGARRKSRA